LNNTRQILKNRCLPNVIASGYLEDYISNGDLSKAFDGMEDINLKEAHKTKEWNSTFQYTINNVIGRLFLVENLRKMLNSSEEKILLVNPINGLITYLLMTCCDKLGQAPKSSDFLSWLVSEKPIHSSQKKEALDRISTLSNKDSIESSKELYKTYSKYYGVKNSFYNFFEKCPKDLLDDFLSSFEIREFTVPITENFNYSKEEKIKFLYNNRNSYTHGLSTLFGFQSNPFPDQNDEESQSKYVAPLDERGSRRKNIEISNLFYKSFVECIKNVLANDILAYIE
jgi:hypothetical protein